MKKKECTKSRIYPRNTESCEIEINSEDNSIIQSDSDKLESLNDPNNNNVSMNKIDLEKLTDSEIMPQKRLFSFFFSRKIPTLPSNNERKVYPLYHTNVISYILFLWVLPILKVGYKRTLQPDDLFKLDDKLKTETIYDRFAKNWEQELTIYSKKFTKKNPNATEKEILQYLKTNKYLLMKVILKTFRTMFGLSVLLCILAACSMMFNPMLTKKLIYFVEEKEILPHLHVNKGVGYSIGISLLMVNNNIMLSHCLQNAMIAGAQIRTVLGKALLSKSLKLSLASHNIYTDGKINSIMGTDLNRLEVAVAYQPMLLSIVPPLIIALVLLLVNLGPISLVGLGLIVLTLLFNMWGFKKLLKLRLKANVFTDARVTLMREIINSLKMIKYYAWEEAYEANVQKERIKEIKKNSKMQYIRNFFTALFLILPNLSSMIVFLALYKLKGHNKNVDAIFSSLTLFQAVCLQMVYVPISLATGSNGYLALGRVQEFLLAEEETKNKSPLPCENERNALELENCSFEWNLGETSMPTNIDVPLPNEAPEASVGGDNNDKTVRTPFNGFTNINLEIEKGEFIIVTGSIGTGKSSLLMALADIMQQVNPLGTFKKTGSLLLCGNPWIQNTTIRNNILFGSSYEPSRYDKIVDACCLSPDMEMLPNGDLTEVGEHGLTLSGGQKARINLARSCYRESDIYLFDDVLSAVDAKVGKHIMQKCMMELLDGKTRILATHQLSLIKYASRVIFLGVDGTFNIGTVATLKEKSLEFNKLMAFVQPNIKNIVNSTDKNETELERNEDMDDTNEETLGNEKNQHQHQHQHQHQQHDISKKEERAINGIKFAVYEQYLKAGCGRFAVVVVLIYCSLVAFTCFSNLFTTVWLSFWTDHYFNNRPEGFYMGMYVFWVFITFLLMLCQFTTLCVLGNKASKNLNLKAVKRLLHTTMTYIDETPVGRILNRFTKDTDTLDNDLVEQVRLLIYQFANFIGIIVLCIVYLPWFAIFVPFLVLAFAFIADYYQSSSREVKRLEAVQRSFVFNNFNDVLGGKQTIKSFKMEKMFLKRNDVLMDRQNEASYLTVAIRRWSTISMNMTTSACSLIITMLCITRQFNVSASSTGVMLSYVLQLPNVLNALLRAVTEAENDMNSTERVVEYATNLPQESKYRIQELKPRESWPENGAIDFENVCLRYKHGLPLILKNIDLNIKGGERIGICGRTGAGKSTIMTALYRLVELVSGRIVIDGIDISKIGLFDLRSKLTIIPQDPVLFRGNIRKNLDPFGNYPDSLLWNALARSGAIEPEELQNIESTHDANPSVLHKFHLDQIVEEDGQNFSLGERQLLALSRALVRKSKILILDEATSNVDYETDAKIQSKIVKEFSDCTILCIAHRLITILNYDRILVLERGEIAQFDKPINLFKNESGIFRQMCEKSGVTIEDFTKCKTQKEGKVV